MLDFEVDRKSCTRCGMCMIDCPARIIGVSNEGFPSIAEHKEPNCYRCQHCLAICPSGAISILGLKLADSIALEGGYPDPRELETLIKGRRSVRRFIDENLDPVLLQRLIDVSSHAPAGVNSRQVLFTVLDDKKKSAQLRDEVMEGLVQKAKEGAIPAGKEYYSRFIGIWQKYKIDIIFRDAPHILITSAPENSACPTQDCLIAMTYFELFAQSNGVGTLWNGMAKWAIADMLPETRQRLGIPDDHRIGYVMSFGTPALRYARTVQYGPARINRPM